MVVPPADGLTNVNCGWVGVGFGRLRATNVSSTTAWVVETTLVGSGAVRTHPSMPQFQLSAHGTSTESSVGESRATMYSAGSESEWLTRMCDSRGGT